MKNVIATLTALTGCLALASAAQATVVTSIQVTNGLNDWLQVAELVATQAGTGTDVALASNGAIATSPNGLYNPSGPDSLPINAIDGQTSGNYWSAPYIYHAGGANISGPLVVTFYGAYDLSSLTIYGRTDCCSYRDLYNYTLFDGNAVVGSGQLDARLTKVATANFASGAGPEPATWALMLLGFGMVGYAMRKRSNVRTTLTYA